MALHPSRSYSAHTSVRWVTGSTEKGAPSLPDSAAIHPQIHPGWVKTVPLTISYTPHIRTLPGAPHAEEHTGTCTGGGAPPRGAPYGHPVHHLPRRPLLLAGHPAGACHPTLAVPAGRRG